MSDAGNVLHFPTTPQSRAAASNRDDSSAQAPSELALKVVFGEVLRDTRHAQHRTLIEVARQAAVSVPYLSEIERGRKDASSVVLSSVCAALELPLPDLLDESARRLRQLGSSGFQMLAA